MIGAAMGEGTEKLTAKGAVTLTPQLQRVGPIHEFSRHSICFLERSLRETSRKIFPYERATHCLKGRFRQKEGRRSSTHGGLARLVSEPELQPGLPF